MKTYLFLVIMTIALTGYTNDATPKNNTLKTEQKTAEIVFEQVSGNYNKELDAWETNDPKYSTHTGYDNVSTGEFYFDGEPYASIAEMDTEGNPVGSGLINREGKIVVKTIYNVVIVGFVNGLCQVTDKDNKYGIVAESGIEIVKPQYDCMGLNDRTEMAMDSSMIRVCKNNKVGFINPKGEVVIPTEYNSLVLAGEKLIMFMSEPAKWGFIDYDNNLVIQPEFTHTNIFRNGEMVLQKDGGEEFIVYANGKVVKKED